MPGRKYNADRGWEIYEEAVVDIGMRIKEDYGNIPWFISENESESKVKTDTETKKDTLMTTTVSIF